jgi:hypothetical protein
VVLLEPQQPEAHEAAEAGRRDHGSQVLVRERKWSVRKVASEIKRSHVYVSKRLRVFEDPSLAPLAVLVTGVLAAAVGRAGAVASNHIRAPGRRRRSGRRSVSRTRGGDDQVAANFGHQVLDRLDQIPQGRGGNDGHDREDHGVLDHTPAFLAAVLKTNDDGIDAFHCEWFLSSNCAQLRIQAPVSGGTDDRRVRRHMEELLKHLRVGDRCRSRSVSTIGDLLEISACDGSRRT